MKYLFIAEKPSLMRDVKSCYQNHKKEINAKVGEIEFLALAGHVCGLCPPDNYKEWKGLNWDEITYPMIPKNWKIAPIKGKSDIIKKVKEECAKCDGIIVGTDSDQEGYGIYYLLEQYLGIENKHALRFVEHSLTDDEIYESLMNMTDFHKDITHIRYTQSFLLRSRADWLFGMNMTRVMTLKADKLQNIGRVKSPTIKLVYDNSMKIQNFKPETYYVPTADYGDFTAIMSDKNGQLIKLKDKKIPTIPLNGIVSQCIYKDKKTKAPKLYDLSSLQGDAAMIDMKPSHTLEVLQSLYEKHKIVSYPRTQCRYVSSKKAEEFPMLLKNASVFPELKPYISKITKSDIDRVCKNKQVVNDKEIAKESHDALLPTSKKPDINVLNKEEYTLCLFVYKRMVAQFLPELNECQARIIINHGDNLFVASGKTIKELGWRELYGSLKDKVIPNLNKGDKITAKKIFPNEKVTTPPKRLTQATLLTAMTNIANSIEDEELRKSLAESKGIGTPATRATIISEIIKGGYVEDKKGLYITNKGIEYVNNLNGYDIISPEFAAVLDTKIKGVQRGESDFNGTYNETLSKLHDCCDNIEFAKCDYICPVCGKQLESHGYYYTCPSCDFKLPKSICKHTLTDSEIKNIISGKNTGVIKMVSTKGKAFESRLGLDSNKKLQFIFEESVEEETEYICPVCGEKLYGDKYNYSCKNCNFKINKELCKHKFTKTEIKKLLNKEQINDISMISTKGKKFNAGLKLDSDNKLQFVFDDAPQNEITKYVCPICKHKLVNSKYNYVCPECNFKLTKNICSHTFSDAEIKLLLKNKKTDKLDFVSSKGKKFNASLYLDSEQKLQFDFI